MQFHSLSRTETYINDPEGFELPYELCGETEARVFEWKYYRLHNRQRFPQHVPLVGMPWGIPGDPREEF